MRIVGIVVLAMVLTAFAASVIVEMEPRPEWVRWMSVGVLVVAFLVLGAGLLVVGFGGGPLRKRNITYAKGWFSHPKSQVWCGSGRCAGSVQVSSRNRRYSR